MSEKKIIKIKFVGVDNWNRPVFRNIESKSHYGSVSTLFPWESKEEEVVKYFKENIDELEYFGNHFGCEPMGGLDSRLKLEIVD